MSSETAVPQKGKRTLVPILLIVVGIGWLLTVHHVIPGVNWVWVLGLAAAGLMVFVFEGVNKMSVVLGPFLLIATFFSLLRQTQQISIDTEVPSMVLVAGVLWLISCFLPVPAPRWMVVEPPTIRSP